VAFDGNINGPAKTIELHLSEAPERHEQTLLGCVIGSARDLLPGKHDGLKEAQSDDQIARIVADTAVSLPIMRAVTGGLVRGAALINPHQSFKDNLSGFAVNALEGAALNKVGRLATADSALSTAFTSRLGQGFAGEAATQLTVGFGFGAVRTGFTKDTWYDSSGRLQLGAGLAETLKAGAIGAPINLVAGVVGGRIAKIGAPAIENGVNRGLGQLISPQLSQSASRIAAGAFASLGSGYASGAVFGGLDAVSAHRGWSDVLQAANEGGLIGAATAGIMGGASAMRWRGAEAAGRQSASGESKLAAVLQPLPSFSLAESVPVAEAQRVQLRDVNDRPVGPVITAEQFELYDRLNIVPRQRDSLSRLSGRLNEHSTTSELRDVEVKESEGENGPVFTPVKKQVTMRNYSIQGLPAEISLPAKYAEALNEVRPWRQVLDRPEAKEFNDLPAAVRARAARLYEKAAGDEGASRELSSLLTGDQQERFAPYLEAYGKILEHPHGTKVLPEEMIPLLEDLPNPYRTKRVVLLPDEYVWNKERAHVYKAPDFKAGATARPIAKEMEFYNLKHDDLGRRDSLSYVRSYIQHEDSHFDDPVDAVFAAGAQLEKDGYYQSEHARRKPVENRAVHHAQFLDVDADDFLILAKEAPIRTSVIARRVENLLNEAKRDNNPYAQKWRNRIDYVKSKVDGRARVALNEHLDSDDAEQVKNAALVLKTIGGKTAQPDLEAAAIKNRGNNAFNTLMDTATELAGAPIDRMRYLVSLADRQPQLRDSAMERLRALGEQTAGAGPLFADLLQRQGSLAQSLAEIRTQLNGGGAKQLAAIQALRAMAADGDLPALKQIVKDAASIENRTAAMDAVLERLANDGERFAYLRGLTGPDSPLRQEAIERMGSLHGQQAAEWVRFYDAAGNPDKTPQLLELAVFMTEESGRNQAFDQLMRHTEEQPDSQLSFAQYIMRNAPDMTAHALNYLNTHDLPLAQIADAAMINRAGRNQAHEAIQPLMRIALERPDLEPLVRKVLGNYRHTLISHYGRLMEREVSAFQVPKVHELKNLGLRFASNIVEFPTTSPSAKAIDTFADDHSERAAVPQFEQPRPSAEKTELEQLMLNKPIILSDLDLDAYDSRGRVRSAHLTDNEGRARRLLIKVLDTKEGTVAPNVVGYKLHQSSPFTTDFPTVVLRDGVQVEERVGKALGERLLLAERINQPRQSRSPRVTFLPVGDEVLDCSDSAEFLQALESNAQFSDQLEQALVERGIYGATDGHAWNLALKVRDGRPTISNLDLDDDTAFGQAAQPPAPDLDVMRQRPLSQNTMAKVRQFIASLTNGPLRETAEQVGLSQEQRNAMWQRAQWYLDHGRFPGEGGGH
jgi:hypothetical protein